jgi:hypothetical protein
MALSASALAPVAAQMRMPVAALVALPTVVEVFAKKTGMSVDRMVHELLSNEGLRDYAAQICIETHGAAQ